MWMKYLITIFAFFGFGLLSSGGVFTVFVTVGLVPRFADKTHTARKIVLYENSIVAGAILGCLFSVYPDIVKEFGGKAALSLIPNWGMWGSLLLSVFGIFAGMFVFTLKHYFRIQKVFEQYDFPYTMTERTKKEPYTYEITTFAIQDWPWPLQQPHHGT